MINKKVCSIFAIVFFLSCFELVKLIPLTQNNLNKLSEDYFQPEQIHITYGALPHQMVITWTTINYVNESIVVYGIEKLDKIEYGTVEIFEDSGLERRKISIHRVVLSNLLPGQTYRYFCGSENYGWSSVFFFQSMITDPEWAPRFAIFGDLGNSNAQSLTRLQKETLLGYYDAFLHVGDFAYNLDNDNGRVGDAFMNQIQPIAASVPYLTCVGNHENAYNFSNYVYRFSMPNSDGKTVGGDNNHFFSINIGPIHLISFSTEFYYFLEYGFKQIVNQYEWLENDLKIANQPENRKLRPWIITMGHRPMYCTNADQDDCTKFDDRVRKGLPFIGKFGLEEIFYKYGVDLELWAHEHSYERLWPIYDFKILNGTDAPYTNPGAPVHIVTGSAGCDEKHDDWGPVKDFSAFRSTDYGYTRMQVFNSSHLFLEQVSDDQGGKVIDSIWIVKDKHGYEY